MRRNRTLKAEWYALQGRRLPVLALVIVLLGVTALLTALGVALLESPKRDRIPLARLDPSARPAPARFEAAPLAYPPEREQDLARAGPPDQPALTSPQPSPEPATRQVSLPELPLVAAPTLLPPSGPALTGTHSQELTKNGRNPPGTESSPAPPSIEPKHEPLRPQAPTTIAQVDLLLKRGDVTGARLWLVHAAERGDGEAMFRLAETYDPEMLARWGIVGLSSDPLKARELYTRALDAGFGAAHGRVTRLGRPSERSR